MILPLVSVRNLKMFFKVREGWVRAVDGVSLDVHEGETVGLVGESGCGKTSLAYSITQLLPPNAYILGGQIFFDAEPTGAAQYRPEYWRIAEERIARDLEALRAGAASPALARVRSGRPGVSEDGGALSRLKDVLSRRFERPVELPDGEADLLLHPLSATYREYLREEIAELQEKVRGLTRKAEAGDPSAKHALPEARDRLAAATGEGDLLDVTRGPSGRLREYHPKLSAVRWRQISIVFQGAMNALNPVYTVGDQIIEAIRLHEDVGPEAARKRVEALYRLVGIPADRIDNFPHEYSGGMKQRAMIAMALALNPRLVIMDEPTTALDVITAARIMDEVLRIQERLRMTIVIISHDVSVVAKVADRIAVMYAGKIVEDGPTREVFRGTLHPYTRGLLGAFPSIEGEKRRLESIPGNPPSLVSPPPGCRFHPRCAYAKPICTTDPREVAPQPGHRALCHFSEDFHRQGGLTG